MEYEVINYDFSNLTKAISDLTCDCPIKKKEALNTIKWGLNNFFTDFKCNEVLFTMNTDNEFFGIQISPMLHDENCYKDLFDPDLSPSFDHYSIEFDSKLFNGDFTARQILALMIHDINKLNNANLLKDIIAMIDSVAVCSGELVKVNNIIYNLPFFIFALQDTARKMTSAFEYIPADLTFADDFIRSYGLDKDYEDGIQAVKACRNNLKDQVSCTSITINWYMTRYHMVYHAYKQLADEILDSIRLTGSKLVRRILTATARDLLTSNGYSTSRGDERYYDILTESSGKKKMSLASQIKYSGLKSLEDDVYEYRMRIKNVETEAEAIYIIRQINNRMGIISDYLETEELSDIDKERFYKLYDKYDNLREELSKKAVYNRKMYGLFVDYNALKQMQDQNMVMNTYY